MLGSKKGFTLVELLVVITILAILAMIGMSSFRKSLDKGSDGKTISELKEIQKALELYYSINTFYPSGLDVLDDNKEYFSSGKIPEGYDYDSSDGTDYCLCGELKIASGNSESSTCDYVSNNTGNYFCFENLQ